MHEQSGVYEVSTQPVKTNELSVFGRLSLLVLQSNVLYVYSTHIVKQNIVSKYCSTNIMHTDNIHLK